ncbi:T9SS type B sorting domain-containing protein [Flagellimonas pacifica]|uniref:Gliding motility-associated C-terminal domain-containing protein n=1 Tax=Flagellimonas pacifica TaxID=1247520 RepID=A0A285MCT5_9FLAO|nr:T9SS type B sorting domain-containing protein [Allomuricauda parva]SNY94994.1 gliding motility-associated C-terminal domain-containing protein [Allomuricauda parva]
MTNHFLKTVLCLLGIWLIGFKGQAQEVPFSARLSDNGNTYINIKGDYTFLSNSVMNSVSDGHDVNTPYNGNGSNNSLHVEYVDIDSDPSTFNSSSSTLSLPACSQIYWAGLYWAGNYDVERDGDHRSRYVSGYTDDPNHYDVTSIKFRVPGSATYVDIQADTAADPVGEEDDIIVNGYNILPNDPYVCYKNVTNLLTSLADPTGDYFVGNVRGTRGATSHGAAGWTLVVIYENPTLTGKYISIFDGYEGITTHSGNNTADISVSGFNTIPVGPVNARIGVSTLEGETSLSGDTFGIVSNSSSVFTDISDSANPNNNFFNSTISEDGANVTSRNVNSTNAIGFDSDVFDLNNPSNSIIDNGDTSATLRLGTSGDWFASFLVAFGVEIIEPDIVLEKKVEDIGGNDITGQGVNLGQVLDYVLSFVNTGNDDAVNYTIRDVLPVNVTLDEAVMTLPPGVTYTYTPATREVVFNIPDNLVEEGDPVSEIRIRVQVAQNCFDFIDACTDIIQNLAYSTYEGNINANQISDDPSVSDFDDCGFTTPGATNFLLDDLDNCNFTRTVQLCGNNVVLDAGDNFDAYTWYLDNNGNQTIDAGDTVLNDGDPDSDPSTLLVTDIGTYIVDKDVADPCKGFEEIIIVERFGVTQSNPITALINDVSNTVEGEIVTCPNDGSELPQIFLCGLNDTELVQINIPDANSIVWEQLDESSCAAATPDCANTNNSCTWNSVGTGGDFLASDAGQYRVIINYLNGCFSRFYFNIFKNPLDPQYTTRDIICASDGNITVTNMPLDYEYRLIDQATNNVLVNYNSNPSFTITNNGAYTVEMRQQGVTDGCVFVLDNIGILTRDFQVDVTTRDTDCNGLGEIGISVLNVEPQYYYQISQGGTVVDTFGPSSDNNYTFENLNDGVYDVNVTTDDGCVYNEQVTINDVTDLALTAINTKNIDCTDGIISVTGSGGFPNPNYNYAIWSYNGADLYASVGDIPAGAYQVANDFTFTTGEEGDYEFIVVDGNNCSFISNSVSIVVSASVEYTTSTTDEVCFGAEDGTISINITNSNGYDVRFRLLDDLGNTITNNNSGNFTGLAQGDYTVRIRQRPSGTTDNCFFYENFTIGGQTSGISGNATMIQDYTCLQDGIIEAQNVAGGTAPYEYSIDGVNFFNGVGAERFSNLTNGAYSITIRDANNCTFVTNTITLDPLNPPTDLTFTASTPNCPALTSDVTATVVNGNAPFLFEITAPAPVAATSITGNSADFDGLAPGTYTYQVTDNKGCVYSESFTINPVSQINVTGQLISNISCFNDTDGEIDFTVADFNTNYNYTVSGPANFNGNNQTNGTISLTGLDDGTYTIIVTDNLTNCTTTTDVTVNAPTAALTLSASETQPTCISDGSVSLTSTGGWGGNSFTLTNPDTTVFGTNSTGTFTNLTQTGTYNVSVTDANGCVVTTTFTLNPAIAPVLAIVPNDTCYDDAVGLTLTANVTSGGDGNFEYSLNGGAFGLGNVFNGLTSGTYTIDVRDGNNCTDSASITINSELSVVASAPNITACATSTNVDITAAGGDGNYVYAIVADGVAPAPGDFAITNPVNITGAGDYDVYVRDNSGNVGYCEASYNLTIVQDAALSISVADTGIQCSGEAQATITITASGGEAPYQYSINNGTTYQPSNTFVNQLAGSYNIRVRDANNCDVTQIYTITEPLTLSASAAVTQLAECNPGLGAEVRITNALGGTAPYEYSFDGGTNYVASPIGFLLPGNHTVYIRDANNCTFPMTVTIDPEPTPPGLTTAISYECDGEGTVTITPDSALFDYTYEIDGNPNTPVTSNTFNDVAIGTHTITVNYTSNVAPSPSVLLLEDFGSGPNTSIPDIDPAYCYEPQDGSANSCGWAINTRIQDGEYSVTQSIVAPYGSWQDPNDHTGNVNGRFLAINVGGVAGVGGIVYQKTGIEVIPNRDITVSLWAFNLLRNGTGGGDPSIEIQLVDGGGAVIASTTTGNVPKNNNANDWHNYSVNLNPGANTNLDIVIRTNSAVINGNDIAIDDIQAFQIPEVCAGSLTVDVNIEDGHAFDASITAFSNISCNTGTDGSISFEVDNFDAVNGFEYQVNGGGFSAPQTSSPINLSGLSAGNYTIEVRDVLDNTCSVTLNQTLSEPNALVASASITSVMTCTNGGATITASATDGTPAYEYQLENGVGGIIAGFDYATNGNNTVFLGLAAGDYIVRVRDANLCEDPIDAAITVVAPTTIVFTSTPTACYSGNNDGTIQVDVTAGSNDYQFSLNGGPWITPSPATATAHTFTGLAAGNYTINVRDGFGCVGTLQNVTITDNLVATVDVVDISTCADGSITVTASGGVPNLEYAFVPTTTSPTGLFSTTNTFAVTTGNDGDYDVYVRDNSATVPFCEFMETVTVNPATPLTVTNTPTDPQCHDGTGSILVDITSGISPYTIQIVDLDNAGAGNQTDANVLVTSRTYYNLSPGNYTINITDATGCTVTETPVNIANPDELTATITGITPAGCTGDPNDFGFRFTAYPTTLGTIQFSDDGGATWTAGDNSVPGTTDEIRGYNSGDTVNPSMRTVDGSGNTLCQTDFPPFIIPYPLDDLDITILPIIVNCNELQVTVRGQNGTAPYEYTYSDDPANFDPATATWTPQLALNVTHTFVGLVPGRTYSFYVRDDAAPTGCVRQSSVNVNDIITVPLEITSDITPSCDGANNGSITYTVTDNQAPFGSHIRWELFDMSSGTPVSITNSGGNIPYTSPQNVIVSGLDPGNYFLEVVESDGVTDSCVGATENELLDELDPLTGTPVVLQNISCDTPGLIQVQNPLGGGGTYTYTVTGPAPFVTITSTSDNPIEIPANSPAGNYNVTMADQYSCSTNLGAVPLTLTPNPTIDAIAVDNCSDPSTVTITATSAAAQIFYSLDGGTTYEDNGGIFNNITAGAYNVSILDSNGCTATDNVTVHPVLQATATLTKLLDCSGAPDDAQITIEVLSGSGDNLGFAGSYDYEITNGLGTVVARTVLPSNSFVFNTTTVENYTITVYDNNTAGPTCSRVFNVSVPAAIMPSFSVSSFTDVTCNGSDDGTINVSATDNGTGPYTFEIISGPGSSATFPIAPATNNATTASFTGLEGTTAGITYTIEITAANGCTSTQTQTITQPDLLANVNTNVIEFGCTSGNNMNNATITVQPGITGGSGNYVIYEFIEEDDPNTVPVEAPVVVQSGNNLTFIETDIAGGEYTINVYDDNGCVGTTTATINPFDELQSTSIAIDAAATCVSGENITITATGSLTNSTTTPANYEFRLLPAVAFQASGSFTGLAIGTHNFEVRNTVTGCIIATSHTVANPQVLELDVVSTTNITCFGDTNGQVVFDLHDAASITYASATSYTLYYDVNNTPTNLADDITSAGIDADGSFTITGLAAGTYYIEVLDTNPPGSACSYSQSFTIAGPNVGISAGTQVTPVTCALNDGSIEIINPAGGWGGFTYFVDLASNPAPTFPGSYQASPLFTGLSGGVGPGTNYQVWVADQNGCAFQLPNENLVDPTAISATLQINQENCTALQGEIEVVGTAGGQGSNYTYQLIRGGSNIGSPQTNPVFSGLGAGSYQVLIADQWSCTTTIGTAILLDEMTATPTVVKPIDCTPDPGGHVTITVNGGSANLTYAVLFPDAVTTANNATGVFTGLTQPGTYTFTVTDGDTVTPCTVVVTQDLDDKVDPVISNVVMSPVSCNGGSDGSLTVQLDAATAVNPVYNYELYQMSNLVVPYRAAQTSPIFDNLPQGDYRVRVISSRSCEDFYDETVTEPTLLNVSATATPFACNAGNTVNTSTITITATNGTTPYLYSIDNINFQTSNTFDIVDTGVVQNITVYVTDGNSCPQTAVVAPIQPINVFTAAVTQNTAISCANPEEVLITVTDDGNLANSYTYELLPVGNALGTLTGTPTNVTTTFELTAPGSYTFRITDNTTGCYVDTTPYDIAPYDIIDVVATATAPAICFGDINGALEINVAGYTGTYDYQVFDGSNNPVGPLVNTDTSINPRPIGGLSGGNYYVRVTQTGNPLCIEDSNTVTIASPDMALTATPVEVANVSCTNNLGEIEVSPTGGFAPYDIQLTNTTTAQVYNITDVVSFVFTDLSAGTFDVEITDDAGCTINEPIVLVQPTPITADISATPTTLVCYGDTNATVSAINVLNGQGVYQYQLNVYDPTGTTIAFTSGAQSSPDFNNQGAGIYSITVSDGWGCDVETIQVTISEPTEVEANLIQLTQLTCTAQAQIQLSATGGTGPYEYSVDGVAYTLMAGGNTHTFTVPAGPYQYYVRDAFGCDAMISNQVTVDPIIPLDVIIDDSAATINCTGEASATIRATAVGGLGNYSYELFSDPGLTNSVAGPQNNGEFSGLNAGNYYVNVTSMDCQATSLEIPIVDPTPLQIVTQESTDVTCAGADDGTITVEVSGGTGEIQYAITPNLNQFDTVNVFTDLAPGIYDVIAQDRNGCFEVFQFEIEQPAALQAQAINIMHEVCFNSEDGSFELDITGGTAPYSSALNSNADADYVQDQVLFQNLAAGTHVVFVRDAQGCETNVFVEINPGVNLAATVTPIYECDGNLPTNRLDIAFEDTTVISDVLYAIDSTNPADMQLSSDFTNIAPGDHYLTIAHSNGCLNTVNFTITGFEPLTLVLENSNINEITAIATGGLEDYTFYFGDVDNGTDNTFIINRTDTYPVTVIDQNGCEVTMEIFMEFIDIEIPTFFTPDGDGMNDTWLPDNLEAFPNVLMIIFDRYGRELYRMKYGDSGWDGLYNNSELPTGDYWYITKLQGETDDREFIGHFTLYRQ